MEMTQGPIYRVGAPFTEQLNYSNPFHQTVVTVWYNNYYYFLLEQHTPVVWIDPPQVSVKEYLFYYPCPDDALKPGEPTGHFPVLSLLPGRYHYQPVVEEVLFIVPRDYDPVKFRSESAILASHYPIIPTGRYFVRAVL